MVDPESSQFGRAALRSGLLDANALASCFAAIPEEKRTDDAIDRRLARQAIALGHLSIWQAQQMLSGRTLGFKIDKYILTDMLGQGGMGRVYLAKDTRLGRNVALKVLSRERMNNPRAIARFQREGKVGAQLQHENLVRVYDEGHAHNVRYLVMEYIEGDNLGRIVTDNGPLPWPLAARLVRGIALGLDHAHKKGLVHRDVNPFNILVTRDGIAKLTDLGLAIDMADEGNVTRDGATVGTFDYVPPEQARNSHAVDTRSDIYSLGCTFYHILTGRPPFPMPSLPEKLYGHQALEPEPIRGFAPDVPEGLVTIIAKMMQKRPDDRFATPKEIVDAIEPYASAEASTAIAATEAIAERSRDFTNTTVDPNAELHPGSHADRRAQINPLLRSDEMPALDLDLGPELGLTEGLSVSTRGRSRSRSASSSSSDDADESKDSARRRKRLLVSAGILTLLIALGTVMTLILSGWGKDRRDRGSPKSKQPVSGSALHSQDDSANRPTPDPSKQNKLQPKSVPGSKLPLISVALPDGSTEPFEEMASAVNRAVGGRGTVILRDQSPIKIRADTPLRVQSGTLMIRAAEGAYPLITIENAGKSTWLEGVGGASITLKGLQIVAHYSGTPPARTEAIVTASGPLTIDHCTLQATGTVEGSVAVRGLGASILIQNTLMDGYDKNLDVVAPPGCEIHLRECIFIKPHGQDNPFGWTLRLQNQPVGLGPSRNKPRKLVIEHCTLEGEGAFQFEGFGPTTGPVVEVSDSAIRSKSLIAWLGKPAAPDDKIGPIAVAWSGQGNLYNIAGEGWIVFSPLGSLPLPGTPKNLKTWASSYKEVNSLESLFSFVNGDHASASSQSADPTNFALKGDGLPGGVGANPDRVGPRSAKAP